MRRLVVLLIVMAFVMTPIAALAQDQGTNEPYSGSSTTEGVLPPDTPPGEPGLPYTGFPLVTFSVVIGGLVLFGAAALWFSRRARAKADD